MPVSVIDFIMWRLTLGQREKFLFCFFIAGSFFYLAFAILWLVVADELTSDYHERTRLMVLQNSTGYVTKLISS
jgi:Na+/melibiose symporter-like transporter